MNFVIDQGNTLVKLAVFEQDKIVDFRLEKEIDAKKINAFISEKKIKNVIISSVRGGTLDFQSQFNELHFSATTPLPIKNKYKTPNTLGLDRLAAVVGANVLFPENEVLVIDMGTCITFDFLDAKKEYLGGSISPGVEMRFKSLHDYTGKLPLVSFRKEKFELIGDSTKNSIVSGVYNGVRTEIEGLIQQYITQYKGIKIVVTGGDGKWFDFEPKNRIFADEFLVLKGLNEILKYNVKNK